MSVVTETTDLPTRPVDLVVTDDKVAISFPDLPRPITTSGRGGTASWILRKCKRSPARWLMLKPVVAPDAAAAAQYYPADYWYSLLEVPKASEFPGTGDPGNGISPKIKSQGQWLEMVKTDGCETCHQLGNKYTRTIPAMFSNLTPAESLAAPRAVRTSRPANDRVAHATWLHASHRGVG